MRQQTNFESESKEKVASATGGEGLFLQRRNDREEAS